MMHVSLFLYSVSVLLTVTFSDLQDKPKISSKGADLYLSSGTEGNIVFDHSQQGKIFFGVHELNFTKKAGPPGPPGKAGTRGDRGNKGDKGDSSDGTSGTKGNKGDRGPPGRDGERGNQGWPGSDGAPGSNGAPGPEGAPGPKGAPGPPGHPGSASNVGPVIYYTDLDKKSENCNSSMVGVLRHSMKAGLQLCTQVGWRNIALDINPPHCTKDANVPERNLQAFYYGNPGIMFQFNSDIKPIVNPSDYNASITAEILPLNSKPLYVEAVMRQAYNFTGMNYVNVTGIPETFWQDRDWSITALVKFGDISESNSAKGNQYYDVAMLGIGTNIGSVQDELHLGFRGRKRDKTSHFEVLFELNNDNFKWGSIKTNKWHHVSWTSQKNLQDSTESRCIIIDNSLHNCKLNLPKYSGSGVLTIGTWLINGTIMENNLTLDHLIITSELIHLIIPKQELQHCFAKLVDKRLP